jgi:hypothetical protein
MRKLRFAVAFAAASMVLLVPAAAQAAAQPYPAQVPRLLVDQAAVFRGATVNVTGSNFAPFEFVQIIVAYSPASAPAGSSAPGESSKPDTQQRNELRVRSSSLGTFAVNLRMGGWGIATIVAFGQTSGISAAVQVRVLEGGRHDGAAPVGTDGRGPTTGRAVGALLGQGGSGRTALLVGAFLALAGWAGVPGA